MPPYFREARVIPSEYVWLFWSIAFLVPWLGMYAAFPRHRRAMVWSSIFTTPFGLTEPLFVPEYWSPPSLFDLAMRTGFDIESLVFCFGIGGVGAVLVNLLTGQRGMAVPESERHGRRHRFHRWALTSPFLIFLALWPLGWNPIYPGIVAMVAGGLLTVWCRPDLARNTVCGGVIFLGYYVVFLLLLHLTGPAGYIEEVWNLAALSGIRIGFMPLEELLFAFGFGTYWSGLY
ncbi:MAG: hypothetical protein HKO53_11000, partial [Gemmatimonadetes bacterium]|nr:hypothetical protein [Gemmatimonadota bacterium]